MGPGAQLVTQEYSDQDYWNDRYLKSGSNTFEWYQRYDSLKFIINPLIPKDFAVLQIGVGNSKLQIDMALDGYTSITSTDFSEVVIEQMQQSQEQPQPQLQYAVADARSMPQYADGIFGAVLDKGTMDAMACGDSAAADIHCMLMESSRVLQPGGMFVGISYGSPRSRLMCFLNGEFGWDPVLYTIERPDSTSPHVSQPVAPKAAHVTGPYTPREAFKLLDSDSDSVHYVYACRKHDLSAGDRQ